MELKTLNGNIIGVITKKREEVEILDNKVSDIIKEKVDGALKIVGLNPSYKDKKIHELSIKEKNKVILASKLNDDVIILEDFTKGLLVNEKRFYKNLFKKLKSYGKKIILVGNDIDFLLNLVDNIYVINNDSIIYNTTNLFDSNLYQYVDMPKIIEFIRLTREKGIKIEEYTDFNELLKAIYRLKA